MSDDLSDDRLVRNEQITRSKNLKVKNAITNYFHKDPDVKSMPMKFNCECSDLNCEKHIKTTIDTFEKTHKRKDRFMVVKGHETPSVEKIVAEKTGYAVVQKEALEP